MARVDSLRRSDADRLYRALRSALESAIAKGGVHTGDVIWPGTRAASASCCAAPR